jgi:hypothetical protein
MLPYEPPAQYLKSHKDLAERLNTAFGGAYAATRTSYNKVGVLMIHWANDDIGVNASQDQSASVWRNIYGYMVSRFVIPSGRTTQFAQSETRRALCDMMKELDCPNSLLIVQYSGHSGGGNNECLWR